MDDNLLIFKHGCYAGDLIYSLAGIKAICDDSEHKAVIYQWLNQHGRLYEGAVHPWGGPMMNDFAFQTLAPLIQHQPYVHSFKEWSGEKVMIDMDKLRQVKSHMPYGNIVLWMALVFAEMRPRYWEPWLEVSDYRKDLSDYIIVNRTSRYHGEWIDYFHLKEYQDRLLFLGLPDEHLTFMHDWDIKCPRLDCKDAYEMAVAIASCKLFIGNQSMCFAIAEAMKTPRLLEICDYAPNVHPCGEGSFYFRTPEVFRYLVDKLVK